MELKSKYFAGSMNVPCKDILSDCMIEMIAELSANAIFVMSTDIDDSVIVKITATIVDILKNSKLRFMPLYLVIEGFTRGSLGELGGTSRFTIRNVNTWMHAMYEKLAQINVLNKNKEDARRRYDEEMSYRKNQKHNAMFGTAVYIKLVWVYTCAISADEWEFYILDAIVVHLKAGEPETSIKPSMIR